jgi:hypothetical protein
MFRDKMIENQELESFREYLSDIERRKVCLFSVFVNICFRVSNKEEIHREMLLQRLLVPIERSITTTTTTHLS